VIVPEHEVKAVLRTAGVAVPNGTTDLAGVGGLRAPLVVKAFGPDIVHKTAAGGVRLDVTHDEVDDAVASMAGIGAAGFYVEEQAAPGIEVLVGVTRTPFGLAVAVGLGGVLTEALDDVALGLLPVDARQLVSSFRAAAVLDGLDRAALVQVIDAVVRVATSYGDALVAFECNPVRVYDEGAVALDARLILRDDAPTTEPAPVPLDLDALLTPRTVAVAGASTTRPGFGNRALDAYKAFGWKEQLFAVHPSADEVDGVPAVPSVAEVPGGVDYLLVAVPAAACAALLAGAAGHVKVAHVVSGGFGEAGADELQASLRDAVRAAGIRMLGPNCMGLYAPAGRQTFLLDVSPEPGGVAIVSQSGGLGGDIVRMGASRGLRYSCVVTVGNAIDVTAGEVLERLAERDDTEVVGVYVEGTADGERLLRALRALRARRIPVALLVGGLSRQGSRAVSSHTGSLAGDRRLWEAIGRDTGATIVDDLDVFLGVLVHLQRYRDHAAGGDPGTLVVGVGGGASVLATDACDAAGLEVRRLRDGTIAELRALGYGVGTSVVNPLEIPLGPVAPEDALARVLDPLLAHDPMDDVLLHVNVNAYYGYGSGAAPLLRQFEHLRPDERPSRLTLVLRNLDAAPVDERDAIVAAAPVPAYRTFAEAATAIAATKRFRAGASS